MKLSKLLHIHYFNRPIVSRYITFRSRDIIYECRCGKRKSERVRRSFDTSFPIETATLLGKKDFDEILNSIKDV